MVVKLREQIPPRRYQAGDPPVTISDCGRIELAADEQVTFVGPNGSEHDVCRKSWGYYATGSLNGRLPQHGLRPVLARNAANRWYVLLVEIGRETEFEAYLQEQQMRVMAWLDGADSLQRLADSRDRIDGDDITAS